jgi:aryl-alcohol dehydrogenase-like predicted oxidoreductase
LLGKRKLGKTDIEVSSIGIGVMLWFDGKGLIWGRMPKVETEVKDTIIKEAFDGGVNFFDTAEMYGFGKSEMALSAALQANNIEDRDVVIGTKWRPLFRRARNMRKSINARIKFLNPYTIDLYMIHFPWFTFSTVNGQMNEMSKLIQKDKVRSVGVSNFKEERMRKAHEILEQHDIPLAVNQVQYNLINREIETNGVLEAAKELGVQIQIY